jgi:hypothetical protein
MSSAPATGSAWRSPAATSRALTPNLNSEVVPADGLATELHQATQQVFHGTERASRLILPVAEGTLP